ncbi:hypothetical protein BEL01nite_07910 [Bradyrhizobium elkanii]|nr:hypothetical protein BEL01nite_07910 [Bradyrhizobium elkanii]
MAAQRRRHHLQALRRAAEMQFLGSRDEAAKLVQFQDVASLCPAFVMAGLVPATTSFLCRQDVDARHKAGHDAK